MTGQLDRVELIARLLGELEAGGNTDPRLVQFGRALLKRVDDAYLFRHRLTTLAGQIRDSFAWLAPAMDNGGIAARVFVPTVEQNGYALEGAVIETVMPDQPFIYDTLKLFMEQHEIRVLNNLRVVIPSRFEEALGGEDGDSHGYTRWYVSLPQAGGAATTSLPQAGIAATTSAASTAGGAATRTAPPRLSHQALADEVRERLLLSRDMVLDFNRMMRDVRAMANEYDYLATLDTAPKAECIEVSQFLHWLLADNFVFMGVSSLVKEPDGIIDAPGQALGIAKHPAAVSLDDAKRFIAANGGLALPLARVRKSTTDSKLHRRGKIDEIVVRTFATDGKPAGGLVVHGLFTFKGLGQPGGQIPILRKKLEHILHVEGGSESDYDYKSRVSAFNQLPVEYLFGASSEVVRDLLLMSKQADDRHEFKVHIAALPESNSAYVFVVLPKEHYSDELRNELQTMLQGELRANYADHRVHFGKYGSVAVHFYLTSDQPFGSFDEDAIEARLVEIGTPWILRLRKELEHQHGEAAGAEHYARWAEGFPENYTEVTTVDVARVDIGHLDRVITSGQTRFDIFESREAKNEAYIRIYSARDLLLTHILPVVDNFGVVVAEQFAFDVFPEHAQTPLWVNILRVHRGEPDLFLQRDNLIEGLSAVFDRRLRSDRINRLLLRAKLTWHEVEVFRSYFYYSRQLGSLVIPEMLQKVLILHAPFVNQLAELFRVRFDPDVELSTSAGPATREALQQRLVDRLEIYLKGVQSFDEDRTLRGFLKLIQATVRTNVYAPRTGDTHYTSFKLDCAKVPDIPAPRPMFEIFVHSTAVEGLHLRGGKVARGGIRWSDRLDDYRSEVLGLMATQMLKNAVIVPVGAKGGFVLKSPPEDWAEAREQADRLYKVFIRGLLDLTDNIVDGIVTTPPRIVAHDAPDPYLVVAADKGTAHLSDTANGLSAEYGFWLGDAFASGGSVGYDHKEKGITARGTWVCVERHFKEMGIDPNSEVISAVGIGDMSGDVFGNGLLSSKTIKLIGAFDHRHIFLDPNPDPEASFNERKRLFGLKRSKWTDYDHDLISAGGGVFERGAKSIALWPDVRKRLGTELEEVSGDELIRLILKADVHLLWNGGIGTYVKATGETHTEVKDGANDRVRVDAHDLRCKVVGEGGNLGMTMRSRVEFAQRGGRVNLDAIDNSGGVDLSDHEVNLKTLLQHPLASGALTRDARDALIEQVGDEVCDLVLADNFGQALAISLDEVRSRRDIWSVQHGMMFLRERVAFSRYAEHLPRTADVVRAREALALGFLRPELAKLLSYAKQYLSRRIIAEPIAPRAELRTFLEQYFPKAVVERHGDALDEHFLFDEIAGTVITNRIVEQAGVGFVALVETATERHPSDIAAAYLAADQVLDASALRERLRRDGRLSTDVSYPQLLRIEDTLTALVKSILWTRTERASLAALTSVRAVAGAMAEGIATLLPERYRPAARDDAKALEAAGLDLETARRLARLPWLGHAAWIAEVADAVGATTSEARRHIAERWMAAGYASGVLELLAAIERQSYSDRWDFTAVGPIAKSLYDGLGRLTRLVLAHGDVALQDERVGSLHTQIAELLHERVPVSAMIVVAERFKQRLDQISAHIAATTPAAPEEANPEAAPAA